MSIANKEARETNYWLRLLAASDIVPADKLTDITDESSQLIAILTTIVKRSGEPKSGLCFLSLFTILGYPLILKH